MPRPTRVWRKSGGNPAPPSAEIVKPKTKWRCVQRIVQPLASVSGFANQVGGPNCFSKGFLLKIATPPFEFGSKPAPRSERTTLDVSFVRRTCGGRGLPVCGHVSTSPDQGRPPSAPAGGRIRFFLRHRLRSGTAPDMPHDKPSRINVRLTAGCAPRPNSPGLFESLLFRRVA